jgi:hypothetical protein
MRRVEMAEENSIELIDAAIAERVERIEEASALTTPHGRVRILWARAARRTHPSRVAEVVELMRSDAGQIDALVSQGQISAALNLIDKIADKIVFGGFSRPKELPPEIDRVMPTLRMFGYLPQEIDVVRAKVSGGAKVGRVDWWSIEIGDKNFARDELRRASLPAWMSEAEICASLAKMPQVPTAGELKNQAKSDPALRRLLDQVSKGGVKHARAGTDVPAMPLRYGKLG